MKTFFLWIAVCAWAQPGLERPVLGYLVDAGGAWHAIEGVAGALTVRADVEDAHPYEPATELSIEVRDGVFFVVDARGGVKDILPVEAQLAVLLDDGVLYATQAGLVLKRVASETRIKCAGVTELRAMSREYVQVSTLDGELVLRVTSGREALFALPPVPSAEVVE